MYRMRRFEVSASSLLVLALLFLVVGVLFYQTKVAQPSGNQTVNQTVLQNTGGVALSVTDPGLVKSYFIFHSVKIVKDNGSVYTIMNKTMEVNMTRLRELNLSKVLTVAILPIGNYTKIVICLDFKIYLDVPGFQHNFSISRVIPGGGMMNWSNGCLIIILPQPINVTKGMVHNVTLDFSFDESLLANSIMTGQGTITLHVTPVVAHPMPWSMFNMTLEKLKQKYYQYGEGKIWIQPWPPVQPMEIGRRH